MRAQTFTWNGRKGAVILGPTEHRVARWLADVSRHGRVTIRTTHLAAVLGLERSEAYRITRRLRILGLFGIENDQGGTRGGRRYWRTVLEHDGAELDHARHREAWSRIMGWARAKRARIAAAIQTIEGSRRERGRSTVADPHAGRRFPLAGLRQFSEPGPESAARAGPGSILERLIVGGLKPELAEIFGGIDA